jgi:hypothetical protein
MDPIRSLHEKDIVCGEADVDKLKHQEYLPRGWLVGWLPKSRETGNELRNSNGKPSCQRYPSEEVCGTTPITLTKVSPFSKLNLES